LGTTDVFPRTHTISGRAIISRLVSLARPTTC
jgi:hypothetical protein